MSQSTVKAERLYASLMGPLLGLYYPLPEEFSEQEARVALNSSRLRHLWCSIYTEHQVDEQIKKFGGGKLADGFSKKLDYDANAVRSAA